MNLVLIGAGGFLGTALLNKFRTQPRTFSKLHIYSSSHQTVDGETRIQAHYYNWPQLSIMHAVSQKIIRDADIIIYAAGAGIQSAEVNDPARIYNLNLFEPAKLVQQLIQIGFTGQFITFGSYFETGINQINQLLNEEQFLKQSNPLPNDYCRSKKQLTNLHDVFTNIGIPFQWLHLILTNIYGPGENNNRLIPYIISQAKSGNPLHFTSGGQVRQYTFIQDVVDNILALLGKASGLYNITNVETTSVRSLIENVLTGLKDKLGVMPEIHFDLPERRDTSMYYLSISPEKARSDYGISCTTDIFTGVANYFK